jgi:hypothetical protein
MLDVLLGCMCLGGTVFFLICAALWNERRRRQLAANPMPRDPILRWVHGQMRRSVASGRRYFCGLALLTLCGALVNLLT